MTASETTRGTVNRATNVGNPGVLIGTQDVGGQPYARYRATNGTWVSASLQEQGYATLYGRNTGYGAYTGLVRSSDGTPLTNPDRIRPGQEYLNVEDEVVLRDPDESGELTVDEIQQLATCLYAKDKELFKKYWDEIKKLVIERLEVKCAADDVVVVPTSSLNAEALVGTHPLLEDFMLLHRALDVKKVQAEVRRAELENVRLAARALRGEDEDPEIEKKIVVENGSNVVIDTE